MCVCVRHCRHLCVYKCEEHPCKAICFSPPWKQASYPTLCVCPCVCVCLHVFVCAFICASLHAFVRINVKIIHAKPSLSPPLKTPSSANRHHKRPRVCVQGTNRGDLRRLQKHPSTWQNRAHLSGMKLHFLEIAEHKTKMLNTKKHPSRQNRVKTQLYSFEITLHVENGAQTWDRRAAHWALLARCLPTSTFLCFLHQLFAMQPPHERTPTQQFLSQTGTVSSMQERLGQGNRTD